MNSLSLHVIRLLFHLSLFGFYRPVSLLYSLPPLLPAAGLRWPDAIRFPNRGPPLPALEVHTGSCGCLQLSTALIARLIGAGELRQFVFSRGTAK